MIRPAAFGLAAALLFGLSSAGSANDLRAVEQFSGNIIALQPQGTYANLTLRVSGPNDYQASATFPSGIPTLDLSRFGPVVDGTYHYHLTGTTGETVIGSNREDGRPASTASPYQLRTVSKSGSFLIKGGAIVSRTATEPKRSR